MRPSIGTAAGRRAKGADAPWRWRIGARTLWIVPDQPCRVLSWAPLGGGVRIAGLLVNHQVELDDRAAARYCGKHMLPGELIGRAVHESCARAFGRIR